MSSSVMVHALCAIRFYHFDMSGSFSGAVLAAETLDL